MLELLTRPSFIELQFPRSGAKLSTHGAAHNVLRIVCYLVLLSTRAYPAQPFVWKDAQGAPKTSVDLEQLLTRHKEFLTQVDHELVRGEPKADGSLRLRLDQAKLPGWHLDRALLMMASLQDTDLEGAVLTSAEFLDANLRDVFLRDATLDGSDFLGADLTNARLMNASMKDVNLTGANMEEADVDFANLNGAVYEPQAHPKTDQIARAKGLDRLRFKKDPSPLTELKRRFKENGFLHQYKQVVAAIRRNDSNLFQYVLFDLTCEFGSNPLRPFIAMFVLVPLFAVPYLFALRSRSFTGLYLLYTGCRVNTGKERQRIRKLEARSKGYHGLLHDFRTALTFSLMRAFDFGFREIQVGSWVRLAQPREFDLKARGWPRSVAAVQSIVGVYLLSLAILSFFSAPFDW